MVTLFIAILGAAALLTALVLVIREMASARTDLPLNAEWIDELSPERYRPMMRLLDECDVEFLRLQPGFTPRMAARLRMQRRQIFLGYLRRLKVDFRRVCTAVKTLMLQSSHDRPDLAALLLRSQANFELGMAMITVRVTLYRWGICGVDASVVVAAFDSMRLELKSLSPAALGAAA